MNLGRSCGVMHKDRRASSGKYQGRRAEDACWSPLHCCGVRWFRPTVTDHTSNTAIGRLNINGNSAVHALSEVGFSSKAVHPVVVQVSMRPSIIATPDCCNIYILYSIISSVMSSRINFEI